MKGSIVSKAIVFSFFFSVIFLVGIMVTHKSMTFDEKTGCIEGGSVTSVTAIIFDQSDEFETGDYGRSRDSVKSIVNGLSMNEKLIFVEPNASSHHEPILHYARCAPKNTEEANIFLDSPNKIEEEFNLFVDDVMNRAEPSFKRRQAAQSPILETLNFLAKRPDFSNSLKKNIYIFSDMIQNSNSLNFYKKIPRYSNIGEYEIPIENFSLSGAEVYMVYVARRDNWEKRDDVREFWRDLFSSKGAKDYWDFDIQK